MVRTRFLDGVRLETIHQTLVAAFADYPMDVSRFTLDHFRLRVIKNAVALDACVGAYDGDRLVGVTLFGLDRYPARHLAAFDVATGILPDFRGRSVARAMFDFARDALRSSGVSRCFLEVLQDNKVAIRAYQKAGFSIVREFVSVQLPLDRVNLPLQPKWTPSIQRVSTDALDAFSDHLDWQPSWENRLSGIARIPHAVETYAAFAQGRRVGVLAFCPMLPWVLCLLVDRDWRRRGVATALVHHLVTSWRHRLKTVMLHNVDATDRGMIAFLTKCGCTYFVDQFEMSMPL